MNILVIGGSGFLGSHVADQLSIVGYNVSIFDTTPSKWLRSDQKMIIGNIMNMNELICAVKNIDIVYNYAAIADLDEAIKDPIKTVNVNILGNVHALEACLEENTKRYIYASTVYVYSNEGGFYRCSKQAAEKYVEEYQERFSLDYTILRYGSLYGPRSDYRNGLWRIVKNAIETKKVNYEGSAEALREYIHVEDAARAILMLFLKNFKTTCCFDRT